MRQLDIVDNGLADSLRKRIGLTFSLTICERQRLRKRNAVTVCEVQLINVSVEHCVRKQQ